MHYARCRHCDSGVHLEEIPFIMSQTDSEVNYKCPVCGYISNSCRFTHKAGKMLYKEIKEILVLISDITYDNDGYEHPDDLKKLISELREYAKQGIRMLSE